MSFKAVFIITCLIISAFASLKKCCPKGQVVEKVIDGKDNIKREFSCMPRADASNASQVNLEHLHLFSPELIGYNILIDENNHWPMCSESRQLEAYLLIGSRKTSELSSCVDVMNSSYYILTCENNSESMSDFIEIFNLRKCCDENYSYDVYTRQCVNSNRSLLNSNFKEFISNKSITMNVVFEIGIPECDEDEVLVEYHSLVHNLEIYKNSLSIKTNTSGLHPDIVNAESFCIEATANSEISPPTDADLKHFLLKQISKFIAKVCRPKSICKQIPCVQKCCREGERMVYGEELFCEKHDTHLEMNFYNFNIKSAPKTPSPMEPSG